jgi:hypothetical protein
MTTCEQIKNDPSQVAGAGVILDFGGLCLCALFDLATGRIIVIPYIAWRLIVFAGCGT